MNQPENSNNLDSGLSKGVVLLLLAGCILPFIILAGFGVYAIIKYGYSLYFVGLLAISAAIIFLVWLRVKKNFTSQADEDTRGSLVNASADWGSLDLQVWNSLNNHIQKQLSEDSDWEKLQNYTLEIIALTAEEFHRDKLAFSIPESLKMVEEISRRYRCVLKTHVPFIENIQISYLKLGFDQKEKVGLGFNAAKQVFNTYRVLRMASPLTAIITEVRNKLVGKMFSSVSAELQYKLKQALLQEVLSVSIDLYSGRFKVDGSEIESSEAIKADGLRMEAPLDPLRVCLIGQVCAGKSSIINTLIGEMAAETNMLPSTENVTIHECRIDGVEALHLVDLPGFDGDKEKETRLLNEVTNSDLVLWVLKANQSARKLDCEFKSRLEQFYSTEKSSSRKRAMIIGVLNQVDRLNPVSDWSPPYDLYNPTSEKGKKIKAAIKYNEALLGIQSILPFCAAGEEKVFNLDKLKLLIDKYFNEGIQTQLNRRRIEAGDNIEYLEQIKRLGRSGKTLFELYKK